MIVLREAVLPKKGTTLRPAGPHVANSRIQLRVSGQLWLQLHDVHVLADGRVGHYDQKRLALLFHEQQRKEGDDLYSPKQKGEPVTDESQVGE